MKPSRTRKTPLRKTSPRSRITLKRNRFRRTPPRSGTRNAPPANQKVSRARRAGGRGGLLAKWPLWILLLAILGSLGFAGVTFHDMDREIVDRFEGKRWRHPSKIYSDSFPLFPGISIEKSFFHERLRRLGYQPARTSELRKGEYRSGKDSLEIYLNDFRYPEGNSEGFPLGIRLREGVIQGLVDARNPHEEIFSANLEPELITGLFKQVWEERRLITLADVPASLLDAVLATEDRNFYGHFGLDWRGVARALVANVKARRVVQGASTLTQQLVKNFFLTPSRTIARKVREACMALILEVRYSKDEILEAYLNEIYFGQKGMLGVYGVGQASDFYFGKPARELTLAESALLAAMIRAPNLYAPHKGEERILARRNRILGTMYDRDMITVSEFEEALASPVEVRAFTPEKNDAPYFVDYLIRELQKDYSLDFLTSEGLLIFTSLDVEMQRIAERSVREGLERLEKRLPHLRKDVHGGQAEPLQACLVALEPQTGFVRAMVGGRDYATSQFNRTVQAVRQPGSLFKPMVYVTALEARGRSDPRFTAASILRDEPIEIRYDGRTWTPRNFDDQYTGEVTLRTALERSLNCATVWLGERVGYPRIIETGRDLGLTTPMDPVPSLVLGAFDVVPLEMVSAFSVFANHGVRSVPRGIKTVLDSNGGVLQQRSMELRQVVSPGAAYVMTSLLKGVFLRGTAAGGAGEIGVPVAGKTGTTNEFRDAWFAGYTSRLVSLVWVGFDQPRNTGLSGSRAALPLWADFMRAASGWFPPEDFVPPPGVDVRTIDRASGLLATSRCRDTIDEAFLSGTEPRQPCPLHPEPEPEAGDPGPGKPPEKGFLKRIIERFH